MNENHFKFEFDPKAPQGISILTPKGRKVRISEFDDGSVKLRLYRFGPLLVQSCFLMGKKDPGTMIVLVPEGWKKQDQPEDPDGNR